SGADRSVCARCHRRPNASVGARRPPTDGTATTWSSFSCSYRLRAADLRAGAFLAVDLRAAGFLAAVLRAEAVRAAGLRAVDFLAVDLRAAVFFAAVLRAGALLAVV